MYLGTVLALLWTPAGIDHPTAIVLLGGGVLLGAGIVDDLRELPIAPRLLVQVAVSAGTAAVLVPDITISMPWSDVHVPGPAAMAIAAVWLVGLINVFNFMDGMDGLVASSTIAAVPALLVLGSADTFGLALAGACFGFLVWNHYPGSIFMGDGGSHFLGYAVGASLLGSAQDRSMIAATIVVAPFVVDTTATLVRRLVEGQPILVGHTQHLYQRLGRRGWSPRHVVAAYTVAALLASATAVLYGETTQFASRAAILAGVAALWIAVFAAAGSHGSTGEGRGATAGRRSSL